MEHINALSDEELVRNYRETRNMECIGLLYKRYAHLVLGVCMKLLNEEQLALDQTMQIFERMTDTLQSASIENFNRWIYIIAKNACISNIRKTQTEKKYIIGWTSDILEPISDEPSYEEVLNLKIESDRINNAIESLNNEQQLCIKLFFYEEKSYKEIALLTGFQEAQVKSHLQNGKRNLRSYLL